MIAIRLFSLQQMQKKLEPYGCRLLGTICDGVDLWETGWGEPFTLMHDGGRYDDWEFRRLLEGVISKTMPPEWNSGD